LHRGSSVAETPEQLMRSRYSAYALGELDYVFRTWHPRTRPDDLSPAAELTWLRLEVVEAVGDEVEFRALYRTAGRDGVLHERSRFVLRAGRWVYVDAVT